MISFATVKAEAFFLASLKLFRGYLSSVVTVIFTLVFVSISSPLSVILSSS